MPNDQQAPSVPMGSGMVQSAAEILKLRPIWEQQVANGDTNLQFNDWVRQPEVQQQFGNAPKVMPTQSQSGAIPPQALAEALSGMQGGQSPQAGLLQELMQQFKG